MYRTLFGFEYIPFLCVFLKQIVLAVLLSGPTLLFISWFCYVQFTLHIKALEFSDLSFIKYFNIFLNGHFFTLKIFVTLTVCSWDKYSQMRILWHAVSTEVSRQVKRNYQQ